ncbi:MAG: RnfH family protein [Burkholderiaceae bacterium]
MDPTTGVAIDVAWLHDGRCEEITLVYPPDRAPRTFAELLADARLRERVPAALLDGRFGLAAHGRRRRPEDPVGPGDRVEIVPPLPADPMHSRRQRVEARRRSQRRDRWHTV